MKAIKSIKVAVQKSHLIACEIFINSINFEIYSLRLHRNESFNDIIRKQHHSNRA